MICATCQQTNTDGARICARCGTTLSMRLPDAQDPYLGQVIAGRFRVIELIGEGGMGRVYLAEQPMGRAVRKVAIKTLLSQHARDPQVIARFERECELICQLQHPNTIQVFDFGQTAQGDLYIVMEYVEGERLADRIRHHGAMAADRVALILQQVCGALEEAHQHGIVHRDLKPDNIMLTTRAGQVDFVKVLDFGIAKAGAGEGEAAKKLTHQGMVVGTPTYMSPEQFRDKPVDARSDIYSLAIVAYEMLTGTLPFEATTSWEWATQHLSAQPIAFEAYVLGAIVPPAMKTAILRALSKDPAERPASMLEFLGELTGGAGRLSFTPMPAPSEQSYPKTTEMPRLPTEVIAAQSGTSLGTPTFLEQPGARGSAPVIPVAPQSAALGQKKGFPVAMVGAAVAAVAALGIWVVVQNNNKTDNSAKASSKTNSEVSDMVKIPSGYFMMGSNDGDADEQPVHEVMVAAFEMDRTEVTTAAYRACARAGLCEEAETDTGCNAGDLLKGNHPINCVDWEQATAYCKWANKRLPTEEEWEYAARGSDGRTYPWGNEDIGATVCWQRGDQGTCAVGSLPRDASFFGVFDMAGNVREWTSSTYFDDYRNNRTHAPIGVSGAHVNRGGSYSNVAPLLLRAAHRQRNSPWDRDHRLGFRCARDIENTTPPVMTSAISVPAPIPTATPLLTAPPIPEPTTTLGEDI